MTSSPRQLTPLPPECPENLVRAGVHPTQSQRCSRHGRTATQVVGSSYCSAGWITGSVRPLRSVLPAWQHSHQLQCNPSTRLPLCRARVSIQGLRFRVWAPCRRLPSDLPLQHWRRCQLARCRFRSASRQGRVAALAASCPPPAALLPPLPTRGASAGPSGPPG